MTEAEVRQAISRDFAVQDTAIQRQVQPTQQTAILSLRVPQLAPHSGPGQVFYVFGHRSQRLMQVNILWGKPATPTPDAAGLVKTAHQLRDGFLAMAFRKEGRVVDREVARGVFWLFHGLDDQGRGVDLFLINPRQPGNPPDNPITLRLSYIQNPAAPDVFKAP